MKKKTVVQKLRHSPLGTEIEKPIGKLRPPKNQFDRSSDAKDVDDQDDDLTKQLSSNIITQARNQRFELENITKEDDKFFIESDSDEEAEDSIDYDEKEDDYDQSNEFLGVDLSNSEEEIVNKFLNVNSNERRTLADIITDKLKEKETFGNSATTLNNTESGIPPKVAEVYESVGKMLQHFKSGKLPKALKMLPYLKNWESILWITRPDTWSPSATYACTRIFASNLNEKMAQRFYYIVLLEKCRDDIRVNNKLNYYLYLSLKKALFKPAAFYKGILLPLAQSATCTLREAVIIGSVLSKVSIPSNHSAAVILRLIEMSYSGSNSLFIKVLLNKKYSLPRRLIEALVDHFCSFDKESRVLPVVWHQALLVFAQRYKHEISSENKERLKALLKIQQHHQITIEIRRELFNAKASNAAMMEL